MIWIIIAAGVLIMMTISINTMAQPMIDALYQKHGKEKGIDPMLLKAIAIVESSENPNAVNPEDPSYGLMQIYYVKGKTQLNVDDFPPDTYTKLYDPDYNIHIGSQILKWNISTYGLKKGVAVYNCWQSRFDPADGPYKNQSYVDKVSSEYSKLGGNL